MDVNGQSNISMGFKMLKKVSILMFINLIFILPNNNVYANLNTNTLEENELNLNYKEANANNIVGLTLDENIDNKLNTSDVFNSKMNNVFTINLNGNSVRLADNTVGVISLIEDKYSILEEICNSYINELEIDANTITSIEIMGSVNSDIEKSRVSTLNLSGEIAKEVYDAHLMNEYLSELDFKIDLTESEVIEPETVIEENNDLYIGETETVQGQSGVNLVYKEISYDGLNKSDER